MQRIDDSGSHIEATCSSCEAVNRIPLSRLGGRPVCGRCHERLSVDKPVAVTDATFETVVRASAVPVLADFWATWCGPCRQVGPELERVARLRAGQVLVVKVNTDENPATSERFGIRSIPSLLLFREGREVRRSVGAQSAERILAML